MKALFVSVLMTLNISSAQAVDMNNFAKPVKLQNQEIKISRITFKDRFFAQEFCKSIGMKLASFPTLVAAASDPRSPIRATIFEADLDENPDKEVQAIWGWKDTKVTKVDDTAVFFQFVGESQMEDFSFKQINNWIVSKGLTPYKGLPAICE